MQYSGKCRALEEVKLSVFIKGLWELTRREIEKNIQRHGKKYTGDTVKMW